MVFNVYHALVPVCLALHRYSVIVVFKDITCLEVIVLPVIKNVRYVLLHLPIVKHAVLASISVDQLVLPVSAAV